MVIFLFFSFFCIANLYLILVLGKKHKQLQASLSKQELPGLCTEILWSLLSAGLEGLLLMKIFSAF